ncbi:MAG: hypothetical protein WBH14_04040 [Albidovulum sp.]
MSLLSRLKLRSSRFAAEDAGNMPVEGVLAATVLVWWYVASFQFFDAFRQKNVNLKGAYAVADLLSRQTGAVTDDYLEGLNTLFDYLTMSNKPTWVRVSSVYFDPVDDRYEIAWSYATGAAAGHTTTTLQASANKIPTMPDGDFVTIVETNMAYEPIFNIGLNAQWYTTFIPTRPRFTGCIVFDNEDGIADGCIYGASVDPGAGHDDGTPTPDPDT